MNIQEFKKEMEAVVAWGKEKPKRLEPAKKKLIKLHKLALMKINKKNLLVSYRDSILFKYKCKNKYTALKDKLEGWLNFYLQELEN